MNKNMIHFNLTRTCFAGIKNDPEQRGVIPNSFEHIFSHISNSENQQYLIRASYLEIYQVFVFLSQFDTEIEMIFNLVLADIQKDVEISINLIQTNERTNILSVSLVSLIFQEKNFTKHTNCSLSVHIVFSNYKPFFRIDIFL